MTATHVKNMKTGRVFPYTDILAKRSDMLPCNEAGEIAEIIDADLAENKFHREKTRYLGNPVNGNLYEYTDILAKRRGMVSINSPEEWDRWKDNQQRVNEAKTPGVAVTLSREPKTEGVKPSAPAADTGRVQSEQTDLVLPNLEGVGRFDAKELLATWAKKHFDVELSRKPKLEELITQCQELLHTKGQKQAANGN